MTHRKHLELKDITETGDVQAVIATYGVVDKDGDVTQPGFFGEQPASIVTSHNWGDIMLGKGTIRDTDQGALFDGRFNLDDPQAKALHSKLRFDLDHPPALIEWSYAFDILDGGSEKGTHDGQAVRFLRPLPDGSPGSKIFEVSPVLRGAGEGTRTVAVKDEPLKFTEQIDQVLTGIDLLLDRAEEIEALRAGNGKTIGKESLALLGRLNEKQARLEAILTAPIAPDALALAQLQFSELQRRYNR